MTDFISIDTDSWGHRTVNSQPTDLIDRLAEAVKKGIKNFDVLINNNLCDDAVGYERITVEIGVTREFFDLFLNGNAGYRAQYAQGVQQGEAYNCAALNAIYNALVKSEIFSMSDVDTEFFRRSLEGPHSKLWFPKSLSDLSNERALERFPDVITWQPWVDWWSSKLSPRKGLIAPLTEEEPTILLNGSFVRREDWAVYEQKPGRSEQLTREGWV